MAELCFYTDEILTLSLSCIVTITSNEVSMHFSIHFSQSPLLIKLQMTDFPYGLVRKSTNKLHPKCQFPVPHDLVKSGITAHLNFNV